MQIKYLKTISVLCAALMLPLVAVAQGSPMLTGGTSATLKTVIQGLVSVFNAIAGLLMAAALAFFFYGLVMYIYKAGDSKGRGTGKEAIIWGLVGMFVILTLTGILQFLKTALFP